MIPEAISKENIEWPVIDGSIDDYLEPKTDGQVIFTGVSKKKEENDIKDHLFFSIFDENPDFLSA